MKNDLVKVFGVRQSLIGDMVCSLPVLHWVKKYHPNSYQYWHIARKCSQAAPLFYNHPQIDRIVISDCEEGVGPKDKEIMDYCNIIFDTMPPHPFEQDWQNYRNIYEETWIQAGLPLASYQELGKKEQTPYLSKWFENKIENKTIYVHLFAGYGRDNQRSPSLVWWEKLLLVLSKDYNIVRVGHPNEPQIRIGLYKYYYDIRHLSFIDQIKATLNGSFYIGTDTGFSLCIGAYNEIPQITLLTNWNKNHFQNFHSLAPNNDKNISLFAQNGCDNINIDTVVDSL